MKKNIKRAFYILNILLYLPIVILLLVGVSNKDYSLNQKENAYLIGTSYMTMNNEFYKILNEEISNRVELEEDQIVLRDPALNVERQIKQIEQMVQMGIDVLVVTPVDWKSLSDILRKAKEKGIFIVVVDSNLEEESLADCTITSDNYNAGHIVGEYFLKENKNADLIVMTHDAAKSGQDRVQGFLDVVEQSEQIRIV